MDVSSVKSTTRKTWVDWKLMESEAMAFYDSALAIACDLRGIEAQGSDNHLHEHEDTVAARNEEEMKVELSLHTQHVECDRLSEKLNAKIFNIQQYMRDLAQDMEADGDLYASISVGLAACDTDSENDMISLTSADPTND